MYWSPRRIACRPSAVASCPVTGTLPLRPFFCSTVMIAPARPSLAATTPSTLPPFLVRSCSKVVPPCWLSQLGIGWLATSLRAPEAYIGLVDLLSPVLERGAVFSLGGRSRS